MGRLGIHSREGDLRSAWDARDGTGWSKTTLVMFRLVLAGEIRKVETAREGGKFPRLDGCWGLEPPGSGAVEKNSEALLSWGCRRSYAKH
ncbi:hypothetical protein OsJ_21084 [Oryza sativa Japonica Group]|uniref:Uncharacterized protein n=2 Tax=Oryza TaxID=4527 RepID=A3BB09_ORYSJ|nr:hypothetical protein OsJ_21084 [Oryza sativa Japonica Group]